MVGMAARMRVSSEMVVPSRGTCAARRAGVGVWGRGGGACHRPCHRPGRAGAQSGGRRRSLAHVEVGTHEDDLALEVCPAEVTHGLLGHGGHGAQALALRGRAHCARSALCCVGGGRTGRPGGNAPGPAGTLRGLAHGWWVLLTCTVFTRAATAALNEALEALFELGRRPLKAATRGARALGALLAATAGRAVLAMVREAMVGYLDKRPCVKVQSGRGRKRAAAERARDPILPEQPQLPPVPAARL
jgi:hypothetical protein